MALAFKGFFLGGRSVADPPADGKKGFPSKSFQNKVKVEVEFKVTLVKLKFKVKFKLRSRKQEAAFFSCDLTSGRISARVGPAGLDTQVCGSRYPGLGLNTQVLHTQVSIPTRHYGELAAGPGDSDSEVAHPPRRRRRQCPRASISTSISR